MCTEFKSKKDIGFFRFALGFSNRNLTEIYTELELKNSVTYSFKGHETLKSQKCVLNSIRFSDTPHLPLPWPDVNTAGRRIDRPSFNSSLRSSYMWFLYIQNFIIIILSRVYNEPIQRPAHKRLVSLIDRALHQYRRG